MDILQNLNFQGEKPASCIVKNTDRQQIIVFGLKKDQILKKHTTPIPATLIVVKGSISFEMEGEATELHELNTFEIPDNVPHEVTALEESIFLLVKARE